MGHQLFQAWEELAELFFTPIINPPEVAILGVEKSFDRLVRIKGQNSFKKNFANFFIL